jgi:hypothetical protein
MSQDVADAVINVCFGSKADLSSAKVNVRLVPQADNVSGSVRNEPMAWGTTSLAEQRVTARA